MEKTIHLLIKKPEAMDREVRIVVSAMFPDFNFLRYEKVLADVSRLFAGEQPGYKGCDTPYHDWAHTLGVLLATARLIHGVHVDRQEFSERTVELALIASLFHDCGYIVRDDETGPGARFTLDHVRRSIDRLEEYARLQEWSPEDVMDMECMILCTDPALSPDSIVFPNFETMLAGHVLGSADIVSQMADDIYLEKLPLLFLEFSEAGITEFSSEYDLFMKTLGFYSMMRSKMRNKLSNVVASVSAHFRVRHGVDRDLYYEAVVRNMDYLADLLTTHGEQYAQGLRRRLDRDEHPIILAA